jgi:hypothetical protein
MLLYRQDVWQITALPVNVTSVTRFTSVAPAGTVGRTSGPLQIVMEIETYNGSGSPLRRAGF